MYFNILTTSLKTSTEKTCMRKNRVKRDFGARQLQKRRKRDKLDSLTRKTGFYKFQIH